MKKPIMLLLAAAFLFASCGQQFNAEYLLSGGAKLAQATTLTDAEMQSYVSQYVVQLDAQNKVLPETSPYVKRVGKMTENFTSVDGIPLNIKVYETNEVNAFACADGSVRVYSGLLDAMSDDEVLGVIGHEIGHVALRHSKKQFKQALMTSALRDAVISTGGKVAVLTSSQLGDLGETLLSAKYSRKQEDEADEFGYEFLKAAGKNPWAMAMAFEVLENLSGGESTAGQSAVGVSLNTVFSSHPDTKSRIKKMSDRATADGFTRPSK